VDPGLVDEMIRGFRAAGVDYFSNVQPPTYPDGLDIEVFTLDALARAAAETSSSFDHEHVTPYLRESGNFRTASASHDEDLSGWRWTVDEPADLEVVRRVFEHYAPGFHFNLHQIVQLVRMHPVLLSANHNLHRMVTTVLGIGP